MPSSTILLLIVGVVVVAIVAVIFALVRRKPKPATQSEQTLKTTTPVAAALPKFIEDPVGAEKEHPLTFAPLPDEQPLLSPDSDDGQGKIRILVVDDNVDTADNVSRLIYFEDDMEVIGQAYNGEDGITMAVENRPHIVLMDINMPGIDGITATAEMAKKVPYSQVVIMSVQADPQYMRQAMTAGAKDYQPKPFTADELVNCIRRVYKLGLPVYQHYEAAPALQTETIGAAQAQKSDSPDIQDAPIIAVYSPKGGVGTSAIASNIAVALQQKQDDVTLFDGDLQFGDIMVHLNTRSNKTVGHLADIDEIDPELLPQIMETHPTGLKLLLSPPKPEIADLITAAKITQILKHLKTQTNVVVVDTSSRLSDQTLAILDMADYIMLITTPVLPAIKSVKLFLDLASELEFTPEKIIIVLNKAHIEGGISLEQIKQALKTPIRYLIPYDSKLHLAVNKGQPITEYDADSSAAQAITTLAGGILKRVSNPDSTPQ